MDATRDLITLIPFRALLSIARALGGVGADPHRLPGGKQGLADALIARYGADAILRQWQAEKAAPPAPSATPPHGESDGMGEHGTDGAATPQGEGDAQGEGMPAPAAQGKGEGEPAQGEGEQPADGQDGPQGAEKGGDAAPMPADGEQPATGPEKGESGEGEQPAPPACPQGDAPAPAPDREDPMSAMIRAIAADEAARAVYPVADWANNAMLPHLAGMSERMAHGRVPQGHETIPGPAPSGAGPFVPWQRPPTVQHRLAPKLLALVQAGATPLLVGPAGTGKSYAAKAAAESLGRSFGSASLSAGVSESALMGWLLPVGESGRFDYVPAPFVTLYEQGNSVFLFDEMDAASPDMLVITNGATANGGFTVPQRFTAPYVKRGVAQALIGAANTIDGADDSYSARVQIDAATLNRFYPLHWDHDANLERSIAGLPVKQRYWKPEGITEWTDAQWARATECAIAWVEQVRKTIATHKLPRVFSVRQTVMYQQALRAGCTHKEIRADLLLAWGPDEIAKLPAGMQPKAAPAVGAEIEGA